MKSCFSVPAKPEKVVSDAREFLLRFAERLLLGRDGYGNGLTVLLASLDLPAEAREKLYQYDVPQLLKKGIV